MEVKILYLQNGLEEVIDLFLVDSCQITIFDDVVLSENVINYDSVLLCLFPEHQELYKLVFV